MSDVLAASPAPPAADLALDLRHVAKTYGGPFGRGGVQALRGINMQVHLGEIFGLLGPNGAGKSTLVKILMTVIRPTHCEGTMLGRPVGHKAALERVGYLPEHHRFPDYLTGWQVLDFYGALGNVHRRDRRARAGELLELVGLTQWQSKKVKGYSKGMRQRLGIANALMNDPELVVLDEPTDGVDPVGRRDIRNILVHLKERGRTVFLNSHLLSELEMVSDRVAILVQGLVAAQGTIDELTADTRRYEIEVGEGPVGGNGQGSPAAPALARALSDVALLSTGEAPERGLIPSAPMNAGATSAGVSTPARARGTLLAHGGTPIIIEQSSIRVGTDDPVLIQPLLDVLRAKGFIIKAVRPVRASLEDLFMRAVTDPNTGEVLAPGAPTAARKGAQTVAPPVRRPA